MRKRTYARASKTTALNGAARARALSSASCGRPSARLQHVRLLVGGEGRSCEQASERVNASAVRAERHAAGRQGEAGAAYRACRDGKSEGATVPLQDNVAAESAVHGRHSRANSRTSVSVGDEARRALGKLRGRESHLTLRQSARAR